MRRVPSGRSAAERAADRIVPCRAIGVLCKGGNPHQCHCGWCNAFTGYLAGVKAAKRYVEAVDHGDAPATGWHAGWRAGFVETKELMEAAELARELAAHAARRQARPTRAAAMALKVRRAYVGDPAVRLGQGDYARDLCRRESMWEGGVA